MNNLISILIGSTLLSIIHVLIPNHWFPIVTISEAEKWSKSQTFFATFIIAFFHILSTVFIGFGVGFLGYKLSTFYKSSAILVATIILVGIGLYYLFSEVLHKLSHKLGHGHQHHHYHHHHHHHEEFDNIPSDVVASDKKYHTLITSLAVSSFLTPCVELEAYYFSAGLYGWAGILLVSAIYLAVTIILTIFLVNLGLVARNKIKFDFIEKNEHILVGIIMIVIGLSIYLLE